MYLQKISAVQKSLGKPLTVLNFFVVEWEHIK